MVVGEMPVVTDVLVIGGGPGGYTAALRIAARGRSVILVEASAVGGTCLNVGCIPSKVLIHAAEVAALGTSSTAPGIAVSTSVDMEAVHAGVRSTVATLTDGVRHLLEAAGVRVVSGLARFTKPDRVAVVSDDQVEHIEFGQCIVATGSQPMALPGFDIDDERVMDSTGAVLLDRVPTTLAVIGAGYIGIELGTAFTKLGSSVSIIETADQILPAMPRSLVRPVARRLDELGVQTLLSHRAVAVTPSGVSVSNADGSHEVVAEAVIVAIGRHPNTDNLGLERAGVSRTETGHIVVGPDRRASPTVLAIGDVTDGPALAHKATAEAEIAAAVACGEKAAFDPTVIPEVVFSDPEIATVGLDVDSARSLGVEASSFRFPFSASGRARTLGKPEGHVELVADEAGTVIGGHLVGPGVSELVGELAIAIEMAAMIDDVVAVIHPHPTLSEAVLEAAHGLDGRPLHVATGQGR